MNKTILIVAAEAREFQALVSQRPVRPLNWGLQFAAETELNGNRVILVADGPGMQLAGAAADTALRHVRPDAVVSTGFCGAIDPAFKTGDVFVASAVIDREHGKRYTCDAIGEAECRRGDLVSVNRVASTAADKNELRATGASVVEMEAGAVGGRARIWNVPFYCIRSVSDTAGESFDIDFNRMRDAHGRFSRSRIVLSALAKPWSRFPALLKLKRSCDLASRSLGDFLADCRF